ncbi:MAG: 50S ribosomal protein L35 [Candidatus Hydrogenedentota bacterium]
MPKMKSHSGAKKRFKITAKGKIKRCKAYKSHLLTSKSKNRKRNLRRSGIISKSDYKRVKMVLPGV